jgi:SPP1 family predicted phage head-tail adaptor
MKATSSGDLRAKITFQRRIETDDGYGNPISGAWSDEFTVRARLMPKMGTEPVIASRMQGVQPYLMIIRSSTSTRLITPAWRAVNARSGVVYEIRAVANPDERGAWLELLVVDNGQ